MSKQQQIKQILEEVLDIDEAVKQIIALDKPKKSKVESTVIQKQLGYEILSFKDKYSNRIMTKTGQKEIVYRYNKPSINTLQFNSDGWYLTEHHLLKNPNWVIHSLKRFSDGEIFTIGDNYILGIIKEIVIDRGSIKFHNDTGSWSGLYVTKKVNIKKPLFKTEDGVDIFDGDTYYCVSRTFTTSKITAREGKITGEKSIDFLDFSTKEAAEDYIILNKPCLSAKEVLTYINKNRPKVEEINEIYTNISNFPALQKLVKSKL